MNITPIEEAIRTLREASHSLPETVHPSINSDGSLTFICLDPVSAQTTLRYFGGRWTRIRSSNTWIYKSSDRPLTVAETVREAEVQYIPEEVIFSEPVAA